MQTVAKGIVDLWHQRLGHPSEKVIKLLPMVGTMKNKAYPKNCDVCLRAKQCRNEFISTNNKAYVVLEVIHCDLWVHIGRQLFVVLIIFLLLWIIF